MLGENKGDSMVDEMDVTVEGRGSVFELGGTNVKSCVLLLGAETRTAGAKRLEKVIQLSG